ncbi:hypothetical protein [Gemelliphila palaticanis]|uniref:Maff2 family protein n=1 Tax=Gemelliphila palaticanis TaxID=81950 RepID=A0ABX2T1X8_9BACL|nr:hypothetical protein [Gemella palaticanis]MBF0715723.1 hypothetical protein [Gemella palaticanis]NYS47653.1 hypothetical protein [Gemella palaticanis]
MPGITAVSNVLEKGMYGLGGIIGVIGLIMVGLSIYQENAQQRSTGFLMIGGGFIVALGGTLFAQVPSWFQ